MTDDPFELFRRTLEQFDASSSFDPGAFGAMGWPMTPFPTGGGDFTPEAGTKRAVRQLYDAIETMESGGVPDWLDAVDPSSFGVESPEQFTSLVVGTYEVWFHSLAQLLVDSYTVRILHDDLVVDEHRNAVETQRWLWTLGQSDREQLLRRCTEVDDDLVAEMAAARERRDDLLWQVGNWEEVALEDPVGDARRYLEVLSELDDLVDATGSLDFRPD